MENRITRAIYDHSPVALQHLYTTAFGYLKKWRRYRGAYDRYREFFEQAFSWSRAEIDAYRDEKVAETVRYAYEHVPFYRRRMDEAGLVPDDVRSVADLPKLPLLEKDDLRAAGRDILAPDFPRRCVRSARSSGSTGFPTVHYWSAEAEEREYGFLWARKRPGVQRGDSYGSFTGLQLMCPEVMTPPFWRYNRAANQTCYSIFHMTPQTMPHYIDEIRRADHVYLEGYPSPIAILGKFMLDHGIAPPESVRHVFATSEQLQDRHRDWIERGFGARVWDQYGQNEKVSSITQYACGHLHDDMDYGVIEYLPAGRTEAGESVCEMVCTGFDNLAAPLIRYRIGDMAVLDESAEPCTVYAGRIVRAIHGRTAHALIGADGRRITNVSVIAKRCRRIDAMQCVQEQPGQVEIRIVPAKGFTQEDERELLKQFRAKLGEMTYSVKHVDAIERTPSGKFLSIISKVRPDEVGARGPADTRA